MRVAYGLGSNLGDRLGHLQTAVDVLQPYAVSGVFETDPVGGPEQGAFLNAVVLCSDLDDPLGLAREAESAARRVRREHWGPRTLDVDVLDVTGVSSDDPELILPHPRIAQRAFVLVPWADVEPEGEVTGLGRVRDLLAGVDTSGVRPRADLELQLPRSGPDRDAPTSQSGPERQQRPPA